MPKSDTATARETSVIVKRDVDFKVETLKIRTQVGQDELLRKKCRATSARNTYMYLIRENALTVYS